MSSSPKKKLAIVTSYDDACGNATYSDILRGGFEETVQADLIPLNHQLLGSRGKEAIALGDRHIDDLCQRIAGYDYVNIQFEYSLFGVYAWDVLRRFKKLVHHSRNLVVTFHRVELPRSKPLFWQAYEVFYDFTNYRQAIEMSDVYLRLLNVAADAGRHKNVRIIVHTPREKKRVLIMTPRARVDCFPLTFLPDRDRTQFLADKNPAAWKQKMGFPVSAKVIGLFGFISNYKDFATPLKALMLLPPDYVICLFGSQHPMSFRDEQKILPYLRDLLDLVEPSGKEKKDLIDRVRFMGHVNDATMYQAVVNSDVVVVPYLEVGQGMSGIASICLDLKANVIFSNNFSFNELKHYCPEGIRTFDMGNYIELAQKISRLEVDPALDQKLDRYYQKYNLRENIRFHLDLFEKSSAS
jgi:glycosyltransferase involved in cell wall biosynthesis